MDTKDIEKCEAELIEQGYSSEDARQSCAQREGSEEEEYSTLYEEE